MFSMNKFYNLDPSDWGNNYYKLPQVKKIKDCRI